MIKIYSGLKGFTVFFFFIAGIILLLSVFFWGFTKAVVLLSPLLSMLSAILIILFLCCVLPLSFFKKLRPDLCRYSILMSNVLGVSAWMMSFLFVITTLGVLGIFFCLFFQFLAPIALIGAVLKGSWDTAGKLSLWITFTYGMRFYSHWLQAQEDKTYKKGDIIDVEIEK